ncbi:MAG TPA: GNAT family N-acetyltransferase, partial [Flavitalea sp.]|nr:GNAT family N-acetyltransferase [Flavitalea sp.]
HCNPANDEILSEYRFIKASQWVNMYAQVDAIPVERSTVDINEVDPKVHEDMIDWTSIVSTVLFAKRNLDTNIFRSGIENSFLKAFLLKVDGRPVATAMLYCGVKEVGVYMVATLPEFQKKGMGQQIMHTVIQAAKKLNYKTVVLQSTPGGVSLYEKMGFEKAGSAILYYSLIKI